MKGSSLEGINVVKLPNQDKVLHFIFYFIFTLCWFLTVKRRYGSSPKVMAFVFVFAMVYGILVEFCQFAFALGRSADVMDALANTLGSATAVLVIWLAKKYRSSKYPSV